MRRATTVLLSLAATLAAATPAHADGYFGAPDAAGYVGAPLTHGPDPREIAPGKLEAPPAGAPAGRRAQPGTALRAASVRQMLPSRWCGSETAVDDIADQLQNGTYRYHAVYMVPADGRDRFASLATQMQSDAFEASGLLERLYNRSIRFDLGTSCGPQYLDISVVRMPQTAAQLVADAGKQGGTFDDVSNALDRAGFPTIQADETPDQASSLEFNYIVWLDGPAPADSCGQATIYDDPSRATDNLNNLGGKVAVVYADGSGSFCDSNAVRHEIGHNLGALQRVAPHAFDGMHCNDAVEDTMCYSNVSPCRTSSCQPGALYFDYGDDDYWDPPAGPPLPWWTVNLNRFLCADASCNIAGAASDPMPPLRCMGRKVGRARRACGSAGAHGSLHAERRRGRRWSITVHLTGSGRTVVAIRCRRRAGGQVRTVLTRRASLPGSFGATVGCRTHPTLELFPL